MKPARILLGVSGGIAAYKTADLVRQLRKAGYEVRVVLPDDLSEFGKRGIGPVIRSHSPHDRSSPVDDRNDICLTAAPDDVVRMESLVSLVIPAIRPQIGSRVDV